MNTYYNKYAERNEKLVEARKSGKTYKQLAIEFNLSKERCRQIVLKHERLEKAIKARFGERDFYAALCEVMQHKNNSYPMQVYNPLCRIGLIQRLNYDIFVLDKYSDDDLLKIRCIGKKSLKIIREANELYKSWHMEDSNENNKEN